jgi:aspartate-semialdehyde dehydrogenase
MTISLKLLQRDFTDLDEVRRTLEEFTGEPQRLGLPSAPKKPIHYVDAHDRPQPRLDRDREHGMSVTVGRLRPCPLLDLRMVALVHNTIRGAAGVAILNAELLEAKGLL